MQNSGATRGEPRTRISIGMGMNGVASIGRLSRISRQEKGLERNFESLNPYRQGRSIALVRPIRIPATTYGLPLRAYSAIGGASSASQICAWGIARASALLPGPEP